MSLKAKLIPFFVVFGIIYVMGFGYSQLTMHETTVTINKLEKVPTNTGDGSNYLLHGEDGRIIELQRDWYMWYNIDYLYRDLEKITGETITLQCYGLVIPQFYWYDMCYRLV